MTVIIHLTPGTLDMRAFTTMGLHAKPETKRPIGVFGTGLKYAVAVLVRLGASFEVHTGGHRYWFETTKGDFRGAEFDQIVMRRDAWVGGAGWKLGRRVKLPFTTNYGRNWATWMAFRELYSNTLDENGDTWEDSADERGVVTVLERQDGGEQTVIMVGNCDEYTQAFRDRANVFLDLGDAELRAVMPGLEVHHGSRQRMFYQGLRALDLGKPALFTYNVTAAQQLTEDRQLGREWAVRSLVADTIASCDDEELIERVMTADKEHWEHGLAPNTWTTPSDAFHRVMARRPRGVGSGWGSYYGTYDIRPEVARADPWRDALRPWVVDGADVNAADGTALLSKPYTLNDQKWALLAKRICRMANDEDPVREMVAGDLGLGLATDLSMTLGVQLGYDPTLTLMEDDNGDDIPF